MSKVFNSAIRQRSKGNGGHHSTGKPLQPESEVYDRLEDKHLQTSKLNVSKPFPSEDPLYYHQPLEECELPQMNVQYSGESNFKYKNQPSTMKSHRSYPIVCKPVVQHVSHSKRVPLNDEYPEKLSKDCGVPVGSGSNLFYKLPIENAIPVAPPNGSLDHPRVEQFTADKKAKLLRDMNQPYVRLMKSVPNTVYKEINPHGSPSPLTYIEEKPLRELYWDAFQPVASSVNKLIQEREEEEITHEPEVVQNRLAIEGSAKDDQSNLHQYYVYPIAYEPALQYHTSDSRGAVGTSYRNEEEPGAVVQFRGVDDYTSQKCSWLYEPELSAPSFTYSRTLAKDDQSSEGTTQYRDYYAKYNTDLCKKAYASPDSRSYIYNNDETYLEYPRYSGKSNFEEYLTKEENNILSEPGQHASLERYTKGKKTKGTMSSNNASTSPYQTYYSQPYIPGYKPTFRLPQFSCDRYDCKGYSCPGLQKRSTAKTLCGTCRKPCKGPCRLATKSKIPSEVKLKPNKLVEKSSKAIAIGNECCAIPCPFKPKKSKSKANKERKPRCACKKSKVKEYDGESSSCLENYRKIVARAMTELKARMLPSSPPLPKQNMPFSELTNQDAFTCTPCAGKSTLTESEAKISTSPSATKMSAGDCQCVLQYVLKKIDELETNLKEQKKEIKQQKELTAIKSAKKIKKHKRSEYTNTPQTIETTESKTVTEIHRDKDKVTKKTSLVSVIKEAKIMNMDQKDDNAKKIEAKPSKIKASSSRKETSSRSPSKHFTTTHYGADREISSSACSCSCPKPTPKKSSSKNSRRQNFDGKFTSKIEIGEPSTSKTCPCGNDAKSPGPEDEYPAIDKTVGKSKQNPENAHLQADIPKPKRKQKRCPALVKKSKEETSGSLLQSFRNNLIAMLLFCKKYPCKYAFKYLLFM